MKILEKTRKHVRETNKQVLTQGLGMVSSAFVLVAALAWNDAIRELITRYLKADSGLISRFIYALIVTIVAVVITIRLNKFAERFKDTEDISS